jgi:hypothetical protein
MEFITRKIDQARGQAALNRGHVPRPRVVSDAERIQIDVYDVLGYGAKLAIGAARQAPRIPKQSAEVAMRSARALAPLSRQAGGMVISKTGELIDVSERSARAVAGLPQKVSSSVMKKADELMAVSGEDLLHEHRQHELEVARETAAKATSVLGKVDSDLDKWGAKIAQSGTVPDLAGLDKILHDQYKARHMPVMLQFALMKTVELVGGQRTDESSAQATTLGQQLVDEAPAREHVELASDILNEYLPEDKTAALPIDLGTVPPLLVETVPQLKVVAQRKPSEFS